MAAAQLEFRLHCTGLEAAPRESSACDIEFHFSSDRRQHRDQKEDARTRVLASSLFPAQRHLLMNQHLERIMLRCVTEDFVRLDDLVEGELVRDEVLDRQLVLGHELQQHSQRVGVHETHRDVNVLDPQFVERELDGLAVNTNVRNGSAGAHDGGRHRERLGHANRFDRDVNALTVGHVEDLLPPVLVAGVHDVGRAEVLRPRETRLCLLYTSDAADE